MVFFMKKGLVNVIILALVLVNLVLTIILVFSFVPAVSKTNTLVNKIASIIDLNVGDTSETSNGEVAVSDLENVSVTFSGEATDTTVSLKSEGTGAHYIKLSAVLSLNTKAEGYEEQKSLIEANMGIINSLIIDVVGSYTYANYDKTTMENDLKERLNKKFQTEVFYSVSFSQFVVQ